MGDVLTTYKDELTATMTWLGKQPNTIFLGQGVVYTGHAIHQTLIGVPLSKRIEMPVAEDMQMGISIGLALQSYIPISIYPRMDFLLCAMNQLVNHLDKFKEMTRGEFCPKVIIRTMIGGKTPLDGGIQHTGDYITALREMLRNTPIFVLDASATVLFDSMTLIRRAYYHSYTRCCSTIIVEMGDLYERSS